MTFEFQDIMDDFESIQVVTPPLVDPLTEAANAHMAALAEAEAAEIIVKQSSQEDADTETESKTEKPEKKFASSTSASSSSASLSDHGGQAPIVPEIKNEPADDNLDDKDEKSSKVPTQPTPLAEEYKEPGVSF